METDAMVSEVLWIVTLAIQHCSNASAGVLVLVLPISQSVSKSVNQSVSQSVSQSVGQSVSQSVSRSVNCVRNGRN